MLEQVLETLGAPNAEVVLERPRDPAHGDLATNVALRLAKQLDQEPRALAEMIVKQLKPPGSLISRVEIAGPGFINFWVAETVLADVLRAILKAGVGYGRSTTGRGRRVNVEFVSSNPTGPLHVGHGRGAALGDAIAALLEATGHEVTREFYVNDAGLQIEKLARSLWARIQQAVGRTAEIPEGGYRGTYLEDLARQVIERHGERFADLPEEESVPQCRDIAVAAQREEQNRDLEGFGVRFDEFYSERELYQRGLLQETLAELETRRLTYEQDNALWLKTTEFGDTKDRVLRKQDGSFTYFLPDIAYHRDKATRGFDMAIDIWGADHHGYVPRMRAALRSLGLADDFFSVVIVQLVRITRQGTEVRFSKRSGEYVTLRDLYEETGVDAARYFFLMRRGDSQFVFDIDLATKQSEENPVYYVQYAHTRIAGIFRTAGLEPGETSTDGVDLSVLTEEQEQELVKRLAEYPSVVEKAAGAREPHRIVAYLEDIAQMVNAWYHHHRVLGAPAPIERARLVLARASQIVLANGLALLGVTAPERM